ncbi:MAG: hypothetical protein GX060_07695 [Firmicutes bacterium]|jgi:nitrate/nitrite-specific signal transduction histidine kinase|nr:hypothetical protein [Bacillota bacterium]
MYKEQDFDLARNIKAIEWLKTEIVINAGQVCRTLLSGKNELVLRALADIMLSCYLLARRLGFSYSRLENEVQRRTQEARGTNHELEQWYSDLSNLAEHLEARRK